MLMVIPIDYLALAKCEYVRINLVSCSARVVLTRYLLYDKS